MKNFLILCFCGLFSFKLNASDKIDAPQYLAFLPSSSNQWHYIIAPYSYIFGINGTVSVRGRTVKLDTTPVDVVKNLNKFDAVFQLRSELARGPWNIFIDPTYIKLHIPFVLEGVNGRFSNSLTIVDYGVFRTLHENFNIENPYKIQGMIAGRTFKITAGLNLNNVINVSRGEGFTTPMIGARWAKYITRNLNVSFRADYGGFNLDNVRRTYDLYAFLQYAINQNWNLSLAWRSMDVKFSRGIPPRLFAMNTHFWGPLMGIAYRG